MKETILITGSSRGIGRATALSFFDENLNIVINYIKEKEKAEEERKRREEEERKRREEEEERRKKEEEEKRRNSFWGKFTRKIKEFGGQMLEPED